MRIIVILGQMARKTVIKTEVKQKAVSVAQLQQKLTALKKLVAPQGFEPRYLEPKSSVLPLDEGAITYVEG